jgi:site-specific DNA recombinase
MPHGYRRVEDVEAKIEEHYKTITLTTPQQGRIVRMIETRLAKLADTSKQELKRCNALLTDLKEQERKLMDKHYKDEVSEEFFAEEAAHMKRERLAAQAVIARMNVRHDELSEFVALSLRIASSDLYDLYLRAKPYIRRLMNQAIFEVIWVDDEDQIRSKLASPFAELFEMENETAGLEEASEEPNETQPEAEERVLVGIGARLNDEASEPGLGAEDFDVGCISDPMVETVGIEPTSAIA